MTRTYRRAVVLLFAMLPLFVLAQKDKGISEKQQLKIQAKKEKERAKEAKQAEKELMKHHLSIQDKKTAKRIKKNQRLSNKQKRRPGAGGKGRKR